MLRPVLAWAVHFYTALGLACAAGIAVLILHWHERSIQWSFLLMVLATLIDATDGTLARAVRVKEVLPNFDGRRLDDLVDFLTYVFLPLLLLYRADLLPEGTEAVLLAPLFAAGYGFSQVEAKTADGYFLGFPSYWNLVAFYLLALRLPSWCNLAILVGLALLTFVPLRYLYPSMKGRLNWWTNFLAVPWTVLLLASLLLLDDNRRSDYGFTAWSYWLAVGSLFFPLWYLGASWWVSLRQARKQAQASVSSQSQLV